MLSSVYVLACSVMLGYLVCLFESHCKDFAVNPKMIMQQWQAGKLTHASCQNDLGRCRGHGLLGAVAMVKFVEQQERKMQHDTEIAHVHPGG